MELDRDIALLQRAQRERELEELRKRELEEYDWKKKIKYTLDELKEGIKSKKQYLYMLKIEFETRTILDGGLSIPCMIDFFDVVDDKPESILLASTKRKISMAATVIPKTEVIPLEAWAKGTKDGLEQLSLYAQIGTMNTVRSMEYFSYEVPTSEGTTYNLMFRYPRGEKMYSGAFNCMSQEKEGMGLLLEAVVHVIEEMNR